MTESGRGPDGTPASPLRVLVTGASGFVGGALMRRLRDEPAYEAIGIGRRSMPGTHDYRTLDLTAPDAPAALATLPAPDVVVHAAARSSPWGTRAEFERENVEATRVLLEHCGTLARRPRVVFVSTASVLYTGGDQRQVPDDAPVGPRFVNAYAATKAAAERLVQGYPGDWVVLRPRAVFGPGDTTLFPRLLSAARAGRLPRFRQPRAGAVLSDLLPIETFVDQLMIALHSPRVLGRTVVLTGGEPVALQDAVFRILERAGVPLPVRTVSRRGALLAAGAVELLWRVGRRAGEPPITRYSVIVYAYSKTFDARACRELFGQPVVRTAEALERLADSVAAAATDPTDPTDATDPADSTDPARSRTGTTP